MKLRALFPSCLSLLVGLRAQTPAEGTAERTFECELGKLPYRLFDPGAAKPGVLRPLVLFLHGAGERGDDNRSQLEHGVREFMSSAAQQARPCFVAAPQCPRGQWWNVDLLERFAAAMVQLPGVDPDRVYLTGLSMGGYATWHLAGRRRELFAAALPVCGGGKPEDAERLRDLPIWAFHGDADRSVPVAQSRTMIEAIRKAGGDPQYTEYPGVPHDSWTRTYRDAKVHEWLFAQRRPVMPTPLQDGDRVVLLGDSITFAGAAEGGWIKLLEADQRARDAKTKVTFTGAGVSGNRVPDLLARFDRDVLAAKPTVVVVYIGINDVWHSKQGRGTSSKDFEKGLRDLVARIQATGARPILCTPSVIGEKADGSNELDAMLGEYSAISRRVAGASGVQLLDLRQRFLGWLREHNKDKATQGLLTTDGVHLNAAGNRLVADAMREALGIPPAAKAR